jgi:amino acid transporter
VGLTFIRRLLFGEPLPTERAVHQRLPKYLALTVFGSDPISSSAYATEEILLALVIAGSVGLHYATGVALVIAGLFVIVSISYSQTVMAYPQGGGSYRVARENLGVYVGLVAAAAVLTDYLLTVAVSVSAGAAAVISAAPALGPYRVLLGVLFVAFITLANLRGARESGKLFAPPVYLFVGTVLLLVGVGVYRLAAGLGPVAVTPVPAVPVTQAVTLLLLLRAFASGCAALTGIEAISDGVQAFKPPESRNAAVTLFWMVGICLTLFIGITALTQGFHILPDESGRQTVLSMLGRAVFGDNFLYIILQTATALILMLAANTAFADFPRLSSILARDGFAPRQLANLGDRLVFSNGIILLGAFAAFLIVIFGGRTDRLIPLYAVGVFISFTLSQLGMVMRWRKVQGPLWKLKATVNAIGATATAVVFIVVGSLKFTHGAFIVLILIPLLVLGFAAVHRHYRRLAESLTMEGAEMPRAVRHAVIILIPGVHRGILDALAYAKTLSPQAEAVFVEVDPADTPRVRERWQQLNPGIPLVVLPSPWRSLTQPVIHYIRTLKSERRVDMVTVIIPEFVTSRWWHGLLHNQSGLLLKLALLFEPGVIVTNVRYRAAE